MKFSYQWLQNYFEDTLPSPEELEQKIALHAFEPEGIEIAGNDSVLDFDVLPNRAHDCLCHLGLANEIHALYGLPIKTERYSNKTVEPSTLPLTISIEDTERCRRYAGRVIENVQIKPSPTWLKERLEAIGQRSINNVVDATNYVMFDLGQPLHAFDYEKVSGQTISIRRAESEEKTIILGGEEITLDSEHLVIADPAGVLAIAGIKGGTKAEVTEGTTTIVLEAANFEPISTRKTSRHLKLQTDSSKRFENEITPELVGEAMEAVTQLILEVAGDEQTKVGTIEDVYPVTPEEKTVSVTVSQINQTLGLELTQAEVSTILNQLRFTHTNEEDSEVFEITIPHNRIDLSIPEDIIEEIGRIHGYDLIPTVLPNTPTVVIHPETNLTHRIRNFLTQRGFHEVMTYTFRNKGDVEMANALASDKRFLRKNLTDGLRESLDKNVRNAELFGGDHVFLFEIGSVFPEGNQQTHLALGFASQQKKAKGGLHEVLTALSEHLGITLKAQDQDGVLEIDLSNITTETTEYNLQLSKDNRNFEPYSIYPFVLRDIAVWLPKNEDPENLVALLKEKAGELLVREPRLFDRYEKEDRVSYAYRIVLQSHDQTLTDEAVNIIMEKINDELEARHWDVR